MKSRNGGIIGNIEQHSTAFGSVFLGLFVLLFAFLSAVGVTPDPSYANAASVAPTKTIAPSGVVESPVRVVAKSINLDVTVANPTSTDVSVLDAALLKGAVRYPTSALLGQNGTVLIFGHSSYLPIVGNQAYKTFDGIQDLKTGDTVSVFSPTMEYRYTVTSVKVADATQDTVALDATGQHLTLVTCDSFAQKTNRFVVTADLQGTYSLSQ
jgi:LPXTG-site transpeptidase (sortase) family protein